MEPDLIIIKPAELILKSKPVRKFFEQILLRNIKDCLKKNNVEFDRIEHKPARWLVYTDEINEALSALKNVFGIANLSPAIEVGLKAIEQTAANLVGRKKTFGVRTKVLNSKLKAREIEVKVGDFVCKSTRAKVNLTRPEVWVRIEIIDSLAFLFTEIEQGLGGLPVGVSGKVVCLMSDSENSFLAAKMMLKRGCEIIPLHFLLSEKAHLNFRKNCKRLESFAYGMKIKPVVLKEKFSLKRQEFRVGIPERAQGQINLSKSLTSAEKFALEQGAKALVLGSTELPKNLKKEVESPIFWPLIGL